MIYGLTESTSSTTSEMHASDLSSIKALYTILCPKINTQILKIWRIGTYSQTQLKLRPIKIIFPHDFYSSQLREYGNEEALTTTNTIFSNIDSSRPHKTSSNGLSTCKKGISNSNPEWRDRHQNSISSQLTYHHQQIIPNSKQIPNFSSSLFIYYQNVRGLNSKQLIIN